MAVSKMAVALAHETSALRRDRSSRRWLVPDGTRRDAGIRLFCIPCAGHGASMYRTWSSHLPPGVELWALQPPGREDRLDEPPIADLATLVCEAVSALDGLLEDRPFAMLGHSMGALIAFEATRELRRRGRPLPRHLFVSGHPAPQLGLAGSPRCHLPDPMFLSALCELNTSLAHDSDYLDAIRFMLPTLRADFTLCECYRYAEEAPLPCNVSVWGGDADSDVSVAQLAAWREQTIANLSLRMFSGDHFFLMSQKKAVLRELAGALAPLVDPT